MRPALLTRREAWALAAGALLPSGLAAASSVKHLRPEDYRNRIVAPRKGRVLLVNFWATWCEPCREELPSLVGASKNFPSKDVAVVLVSLDTEREGPTKVPSYLSANKIPFVCWLVKTHDPQIFIDVVDPAWNGELPYTVIYDRKGKLAQRLSGKQTQAGFTAALGTAVRS